MARILAIDPGSELSAWMILDTDHGLPMRDANGPLWGKVPNQELLELVRAIGSGARTYGVRCVVGEMMSPRGMPVSRQEMATLVWLGRFLEAAHPVLAETLEREAVKRHFGLIGGRRIAGEKRPSYDSQIRALLIDRFGGIGGKERAVGVKASPGPLYGVTSDVWQALALAVAFDELTRVDD